MTTWWTRRPREDRWRPRSVRAATHYTGSARGGDWVVAWRRRGVDTEPDTHPHRAPGELADSVVSGSEGVPNGDVVVVEQAGSTVYWSGPMTAGARLDATAGPGSTLVPTWARGTRCVDAKAGTLTRDGFVTLRWTGFDDFGFSGTEAPRAFRFDGSDRAESIYVSFPTEASRRQRWFLGGGDDTLLSPDGAGGSKSRYVGGAGDDHVDLWAGTRLDLDLASGRMRMRQDGRTVKARFATIETSRLGAKKLQLRGTKKADEIRFYACRATVRGRAGKDDIASARTGDDGYLLDCDARKSRIAIYGDGGRRHDQRQPWQGPAGRRPGPRHGQRQRQPRPVQRREAQELRDQAALGRVPQVHGLLRARAET